MKTIKIVFFIKIFLVDKNLRKYNVNNLCKLTDVLFFSKLILNKLFFIELDFRYQQLQKFLHFYFYIQCIILLENQLMIVRQKVIVALNI